MFKEKMKIVDVKLQKIPHQFAIIPTVGILSLGYYYGYPVFALAFMWLNYGLRFAFGTKKMVWVEANDG